MGHTYSKCPILIFRHAWRRCWTGDYQDVSSGRISDPIYLLLGIPSGERNLYRHWCPPLGPCLSWSPCAAYFETECSQVAKDASASREKLIDLFNRIENFFGRLEIYTGITPTTAMMDIVIKIMVEVLTVLAIATKVVKRGQLSELMSRKFTVPD
jgi:hypothetical protein